MKRCGGRTENGGERKCMKEIDLSGTMVLVFKIRVVLCGGMVYGVQRVGVTCGMGLHTPCEVGDRQRERERERQVAFTARSCGLCLLHGGSWCVITISLRNEVHFVLRSNIK
jgi:hypothetical protein